MDFQLFTSFLDLYACVFNLTLNNEIDFNNIDWTITIEVETTIQVPLNQKTINEFLKDLYNTNSQNTN